MITLPVRRIRRSLGALAATSVAVAASAAPAAAAQAGPDPVQAPGITANLWEWNWDSVAAECGELAELGYDGVQVAPPQNSLKRLTGDDKTSTVHPWWEVYQPVTYDLTSRMGDEAQFQRMVGTCREQGVGVYVDTVINHMTGQGETSYGGQDYEPYTYPDVPYDREDFHFPVGECPSSDGGIQDFDNVEQVRRCNLVGLEDLRTEIPEVRDTITAYLNKLLSYGVSGFRVDAAKHVGQEDLDAIYAQLDLTADGVRPYWALEIFGGTGELAPGAFTSSGDVLGLAGAGQIHEAFTGGGLDSLASFGPDSGLTAGEDTMSFVTNHDTDRSGTEYLSYSDGDTYVLATQWLLAQGYGSPQVYSSFTWEDEAGSPPATEDGLITDTACDTGEWTCDHRDPRITGMIRWNKVAGASPVANFSSDGPEVIAFSKGDVAWAAFNNSDADTEITVQTGLPGGEYCDITGGDITGGDVAAGPEDQQACPGATVTVDESGEATVTVPAKAAVAVTGAGS